MRKMLIILLAVSFLACSPARVVQTGLTTTDTVTVTERLRDTIVVVESDRSMLRALVECDSLGQVQMKRLLALESGERLKPPVVEVRDNVLTATASVDSMALYLTLKDRLERHTSTRREVQVVEVNRLTRWQRTWMRIGQIGAVLLVAFGAFKLRHVLKV